jgi:23S rRNA pseudouridine1911/1915/1917 synthase
MLVYLNDHLVVVNKAPGLSLATRRAEPGAAAMRLFDAMSPEDRGRLGSGELHLVHRLDVGTSGLVVLARDADTHRHLATAFANRQAQKTYLALVWGRPRPREGTFAQPLGPDRTDRRRMRVDPAGRPAVTRYRNLGVAPHVTLVELTPETGRTHQIRVHLAAAGHPIVGDDLYGGPRHRAVRDAAVRAALAPPHPLLHAWRLRLPPPLGSEIEFEAALPQTFQLALRAVGLASPAH